MSEKTVHVQTLPSLPVLLFITFLVLKLTGYISWSWWWVTAPLWLPFGVVVVICGIVMGAAIFWAVLERK